MKNIINLFVKSTKDKFPVSECTIKTNEEGILESDKYYLCLLIDRRFKSEFVIKTLRPYIWEGEDDKGYAWLDKDGNFYDNFDMPIHMDNEVVVGFRPMDYNDEMKKFIDNYWNEIGEVEDSYWK